MLTTPQAKSAARNIHDHPPVPELSESGSIVANQGPAPSWRDRWLVGLLVLCATSPYANTLLNAFVYYDDTDQVLGNPYIRSFHYLPQIFTTSVWSFQDLEAKTNYYRPMMTLGYLLCYKLFGLAPYGFHLVNIVLHAAIVCLVFFLTARMLRDRALALGAAALFALHPVHTESVAWIAAIPDLQVTFFYLLTFWFFLGMARASGGRSEWAHLAMAGSFVLALLSKEQALTLPFWQPSMNISIARTGRKQLSRRNFHAIARSGSWLWPMSCCGFDFWVLLLPSFDSLTSRGGRRFFLPLPC